MTSLSTLDVSANRFGFSLQTSSGDTIELSMYDNKSVSFRHKEGDGVRTTAMSLRHEYGYRFHYEGNGIDAQDQKEIEEAMKAIRPIFHTFLENVRRSDEMPGFEETTNIAQLLRGELPEPESADAQNLLKDRTVDTIDELLTLFDANKKILESAKALFDRLFDNASKLDVFA